MPTTFFVRLYMDCLSTSFILLIQKRQSVNLIIYIGHLMRHRKRRALSSAQQTLRPTPSPLNESTKSAHCFLEAPVRSRRLSEGV